MKCVKGLGVGEIFNLFKMKKLMLIAVMAIVSTGVFAAKIENSKVVSSNKEIKVKGKFKDLQKTIPQNKYQKPGYGICWNCIGPGGVICYTSTCGASVELDFAPMSLIEFI